MESLEEDVIILRALLSCSTGVWVPTDDDAEATIKEVPKEDAIVIPFNRTENWEEF